MGETTEARARGLQTGIAKRLEFRLVVLAAAWIVLVLTPGFAATRHTALAQKAYLRAVELQQKLQAKPAGQRTAAEYNRVIREFRNVYYYDFAYVKAPVAVETMGDLYLEMGRQFHEPAYFKSAIKYYQYAVSQYPGTSMARISALAVGDVYLENLNDPDQAADAYRSFLEKYPRSSNTGEAKKKLKEIADAQAAQKEKESARAASAGPATGNSEASVSDTEHSAANPVEVTEIHNWVGPSYTRVVIAAQGPFQYTTLRLSHPDRIVFDLPNTRLSRDLLKKSVPINGAFLREIRVGQFKPDVTRVVLDVKDINDFSAFPVPNPFRLIIDVHGSSPEMANNEPEQVKPPSPAATEPGRIAQARLEKKAPAAREAPAGTKKQEVEAARQVEMQAPPKTGNAIEFDDQQAVMEKAQGGAKNLTEEAAKQKTKAVPGPQAPQTVKPNAEAASRNQVPKTAKPEEEVASAAKISPVAKKKVEAASTEPGHDGLPFSTKPASPTINGSQTLTRALGLKVARIVVDPGHGGFDTGTIGPSGLREKDLVLDIGLRLRKLIETQTNSEVFMTRSTDKFIPLEERTAIANEDGADLFISIHANASSDHRVRGIETYFLNFTSDPEALRLAARENATSQESVHQLQNLIQKIALNNKIEESQELARDIQAGLYKHMSRISRGIHNRGVRKAPFVVLIGANMPSILTEISFLSNSHSERLLKSPSYREQIAKALFNGIENYISNLGSVRVAQSTR